MISTYDGKHSITIGLDPVAKKRCRNTWEDWCLIPSSRPYVVLPPVNEQYLEIPGMNGKYDITDKLHNYPTYGVREGSWEFHIAHDKVTEKFGVPEEHAWHYIYEQIANYLHGQGLRCILADDPWWYYDGRFKLNSFKSNKYYSTITIDYVLEPYKWSVVTTTDPAWPWDPFEFSENRVVPTVVSYDISADRYISTPRNDLFKSFTFHTDPGKWANMYYRWVDEDNVQHSTMNIPQEYFGSAPVCPVIYCELGQGQTEAIMKVDNSCTGVFTPLIAQPDGWGSSGDTGWKQYYENRGYHYTLLGSLYDAAPIFVSRKFFNRCGEATGSPERVHRILHAGINTIPEIQFICPTSDDWVRIAFSGDATVSIDFRQGRL